MERCINDLTYSIDALTRSIETILCRLARQDEAEDAEPVGPDPFGEAYGLPPATPRRHLPRWMAEDDGSYNYGPD